MLSRHFSWRFCSLILLSYLALISVTCQPRVDKRVTLSFAGQSWVLPLTVEQAIAKYHLRFGRPALFSTALKGNGKMHLEYPYDEIVDSSFLDEPNSDSTKFYNRNVHTYSFVFSDTLNTYDSLRAVLQQSLGRSFVAFQDTIRAPASSRKQMFSKGMANYELMHRSDSSYVAIRHRPRLAAYYPAKLEVLFFYGLPYKDIYHRLTVF